MIRIILISTIIFSLLFRIDSYGFDCSKDYRITPKDTVKIDAPAENIRLMVEKIDTSFFDDMDVTVSFFIVNNSKNAIDYQMQSAYFKTYRYDIVSNKTNDTLTQNFDFIQFFNLDLRQSNSLKWNLSPGETIEIIAYLKANKTSFPNHLLFTITRAKTFEAISKKSSANFFLAIGILLTMLLLSIVLFFSTKEKSFKTLTFYLISVLVYLSFQNDFFIIPFHGFTSIAMIFIPYFFFIHQKGIIDDSLLPDKLRKMGRFIERYYIVIVLLAFGLFFAQFTLKTHGIISALFNIVLGISLFALFFAVVFLSYITPLKQYKKKKWIVYKLFIIANSAVIVGFMTSMLGRIQQADEAGFIIQSIMFVLIIGYQMRTKTREQIETQQKLVDQLKVNAELKEKVNRELEQKVKERTRDLEQANEEIVSQNELLVNQKEEITSQRDELEAQRNMLDESNQLLQKQNTEITDSINYASKIQQAAMPDSETLNKFFGDYFIYYRPRDIVSGDFYWAKKIDNYIFFVAADCTGHGVPGALMSMLGISFLNELVTASTNRSTHEILNNLREKVKTTLHQNTGNESSKDGMDISLGMLNAETSELTFSGAYNSAYIISNGELNELKADRQPIGVYYNEKDFTSQTIQLKKGDMLYLYSDGYIDQFGGDGFKKFTKKRFKELLLEIAPNPTHEQYALLDEQFHEWKASNEQIDDIIVIGIRL